MVLNRFIPSLVICGESLEKTRNFIPYKYMGDPCNAVELYSRFGVDELAVIDISHKHVPSGNGRSPDGSNKFESPLFWKLLRNIASRAFMPLSFGGDLTTVKQVERVLNIGFEKVTLGRCWFKNPSFIDECAKEFGSQSIQVAIDYTETAGEHPRRVLVEDPKHFINDVLNQLLDSGCGEVLLTSVTRDGKHGGLDLDALPDAYSLPVLIRGGANSIQNLEDAIDKGASGVVCSALFSLVSERETVLINYPDDKLLNPLRFRH